MTAAVAQRPPTRNEAKGGQPVARRPFVAGTRENDKSTYDQSKQLTTSTQDMPTFECDPTGFLSGLYILVETNATPNTNANVTFAADGPFNVIDTITFNDTNNKPVLGPLGGYDLRTAMKYGGYHFSEDPRESPVYAATTGTSTAGGAFVFVLYLPIELVHRDAAGSLPNKSASSVFNVNLRLAANATVYGTAPNAANPTVRVRITEWGWQDPNATDMKGNPVAQNPPGVQTTQYWAKQTYTINSGSFNTRLQGIDSLVRNLIFGLLDSSNSRSQGDSDFPDPLTVLYETSQPIQRLKTIWRHLIGEWYGYKAAVETAGGRDYGIYPQPYCRDFTHKPGAETRLGYLPVSAATTLALNGSIGGSGSHTLVVLVNKVVPANGDPMVLTGR